MRRSFRVGLRIGLLVGILFALFKTVQSRRGAREPGPEPWQPIVDTPRPRPEPEPTGQADAPPARPVDEVGEPIEEPSRTDLAMPEVPAQILEPESVAKPEPINVAPEPPPAPEKVEAPVKKAANAAKAAKKVAKKAAKKATRKSTPAKATPVAAFVEPVGGVCPPSHQVKAKLASRLFHLPGMFAYDRTKPDRCYLDADAAEADGFTRARR